MSSFLRFRVQGSGFRVQDLLTVGSKKTGMGSLEQEMKSEQQEEGSEPRCTQGRGEPCVVLICYVIKVHGNNPMRTGTLSVYFC
jgi:hypothetical protein